MKITVTINEADIGFVRRAILYFVEGRVSMEGATDADLAIFAQSAIDEWIASAISDYPEMVEVDIQKKLRQRQ